MLPVRHRLKGRKIFNELFRTGKSFSSEILLLRVAKVEEDAPSQFGFGASLKFSKKAVERNRVKRWMREAVMVKIHNIKSGYIAIFLINPKFPKGKLSFAEISQGVNNLLKKAKILQ
jgi:ribonuclease P protein component